MSNQAPDLEELSTLVEAQLKRPLSEREQKRLAELQSAADSAPAQPVLRTSRARVALDIAFASPEELVRACSWQVGRGNFALEVRPMLGKGTAVSMHVKALGWTESARGAACVTWTRDQAMGLAFTHLAETERAKLTRVVVAHSTLMQRMRAGLGRRDETPVPAEVNARRSVGVVIENEMLCDVVCELIEAVGFFASPDLKEGTLPSAYVVDGASIGQLPVGSSAPVVLVNASKEAAVGRNVRPVAVIDRPVQPAAVVEAVRRALHAM